MVPKLLSTLIGTTQIEKAAPQSETREFSSGVVGAENLPASAGSEQAVWVWRGVV